MARTVRGDWGFKVELISGKMEYSAHYSVESEGVEQERYMTIEFSPQEETKIKNFIMNVVRPKVEERERGN